MPEFVNRTSDDFNEIEDNHVRTFSSDPTRNTNSNTVTAKRSPHVSMCDVSSKKRPRPSEVIDLTGPEPNDSPIEIIDLTRPEIYEGPIEIIDLTVEAETHGDEIQIIDLTGVEGSESEYDSLVSSFQDLCVLAEDDGDGDGRYSQSPLPEIFSGEKESSLSNEGVVQPDNNEDELNDEQAKFNHSLTPSVSLGGATSQHSVIDNSKNPIQSSMPITQQEETEHPVLPAIGNATDAKEKVASAKEERKRPILKSFSPLIQDPLESDFGFFEREFMHHFLSGIDYFEGKEADLSPSCLTESYDSEVLNFANLVYADDEDERQNYLEVAFLLKDIVSQSDVD